jgi:ammonia channel protein AmtB
MMQLGFVLLEVGSAREKHSRTVLLKNILDTIISALCFWIFGYYLSVGLQGGVVGSY